jgi:hypothetical protein
MRRQKDGEIMVWDGCCFFDGISGLQDWEWLLGLGDSGVGAGVDSGLFEADFCADA